MKSITNRLVPTFTEENLLWAQGYEFVAGVDEVGRGALAGPVMAAAVILEAQGDYSRRQLLAYSARLVTRFGASKASAGTGPAPLRNFLARMLLGNEWFTRHVLLDRWFLHANQAAMQTT